MTTNTTRNKLQERLTRYSLAAGAAGLAAGAHQADAAIQVYDNGGAGWTLGPGFEQLWFTYDGNTHTANPGAGFAFRNNPGAYSSMLGYSWGTYRRVDGVGASDSWIRSPLASGASIPGTGSRTNNNVFSSSGVANFGWTLPGSGYLGLVFGVGGDDYYGWMDITLNDGAASTIVINRFAVEDTANTAITAGDTGGGGGGGGGGGSAVPEPGTLALLALGATGLAALRRREG